MKVKLTFPVLALALAAIALVASPNAFAADIDFNCSSGSGTTTAAGGQICSGGAPETTSPVTLLTWTEGGFTVTNTTTPTSNFVYNPNQGDQPPGTTGLGGTGIDSLSVAAASGDFTFQSVNLGSYTNNDLTYTIIGSLHGVTQFTEAGSVCVNSTTDPCVSVADPPFNSQATYYTIGGNGDTIDKLTISLTDNGSGTEYLDNIKVTPEPSSLLLLGTGLLGLAFVAFRRAKASGLTF